MLSSLVPATAGYAAQAKPNIIIVMPDDAGYGDYACLGNPIIRTPAVDAFKQQGLLLKQFHVSASCAPTRASLLSGKHEFKNGVTHTIFERERMSLETVTLPQVLKTAGYTTGIFGKWHLGDEEAYRPENRGFDEVYGHGGGGIGQTYPGSCGDAPGNNNIDPTFWHNGSFVKTKGYCTDLLFTQALQWISHKRSADQPFFAFIALNAAHTPLVVPKNYYQHYLGKPGVTEDVAKFYGMIENIDTNFGVLLAKLTEWQIADNTVVIYLGSDNGGFAPATKVFNAGMRGSKMTPYQGGTRVPCFLRWPAGGVPAGMESDALTTTYDLFPTLATVAGAAFPDRVKQQVEGRDLGPLLKNPKAEWPERTLIRHIGRWAKGKAASAKYNGCAVQNSRFTLVNNTELYDLSQDPGEKNNVIGEYPEVAADLRRSYDHWWNEIQPDLINENAIGPKINPFKELYWKQFGGGPTEAELKAMDPYSTTLPH